MDEIPAVSTLQVRGHTNFAGHDKVTVEATCALRSVLANIAGQYENREIYFDKAVELIVEEVNGFLKVVGSSMGINFIPLPERLGNEIIRLVMERFSAANWQVAQVISVRDGRQFIWGLTLIDAVLYRPI